MGFKRYKLSWLSNLFRVKRTGFSAAVCQRTKRIALITREKNLLKQLVVHDVLIDERRGCEEAERCLCGSCSYNTTTAQSLRRSSPEWKNVSPKYLKKLHKLIAHIESLKPFKEAVQKIEWKQKQIMLHYEKAPINILFPKKAK